MQTNKTKNSTAKTLINAIDLLHLDNEAAHEHLIYCTGRIDQLTLKDVKEVHTWIDRHTIHIEEPDSIFPSVQWKAHQKRDK